MKKLLLILTVLLSANILLAQETKLYHPEADAKKDIADAVAQAKKEHKYVLIQAGGNWCKWCLEFARFSKADAKIDSVITSSYIVYHLNNSKENQNKAVFASLGYPQRFGFPSFIILNEKGERIHTQNSEYLEDGKSSYDHAKVQAFLEMWTPHALNPEMYGDK
jgi:thioredoxin-related protein